MEVKKSILLLAALFTIALCQFGSRANANDGDWVEGNIAQWWWKYARVGDGSVKILTPAVKVGEVKSARVGYRAFNVTYMLTNNTKSTYAGGEVFRLEFQAAEPDPVPWRPEVVGRGTISALKPGQSMQVSIVLYSPEKVGIKNAIAMTVE
jgi:hypothetical protein